MLPKYKATGASIRYALIKKGIYLPQHKKRWTSVHYMKDIINGNREFIKTEKVRFVEVPLYDELKPYNVL